MGGQQLTSQIPPKLTSEASSLPLPPPSPPPLHHPSPASLSISTSTKSGNALQPSNSVNKSPVVNAVTGEFRMTVLLLRFMAVVLSVVNLALVIIDKQTEEIVVDLPGFTTPFVASRTARFNHSKALQFFVAANAAAGCYSLLQALRSLCFLIVGNPRVLSTKFSLWSAFLLDQALAYLLLSALGASIEVAYLAKKGDPAVGWDELCSSFRRYCSLMGASVICGFVSFCDLAALAVMSAQSLFSVHGKDTSSCSN
ncbi:hypothetical protein O6H91_22G012000 [Diphasiastrum complanatum]|uniref:Uncharacterized protein n=1 Tax=Diphasiastrum complanatum TaxID=34168 RepID=A0ACC2ACV3_DIPCM|nr:hypothetical protein O6H91_22G012000 [Diphasiastrum complanatum]